MAVLLLAAPPAIAREHSGVRGRLELGEAAPPVTRLGPIVVYLDAADEPLRLPPPPDAAEVRQRHARFSPRFLVIVAGQPVEMPNDDGIFHNVFSFSKPNDFDLGLYPAGESRTVTLRHPGAVRFYCSIHENMTGTLFVAPSPWYAVVGPEGRFSIDGVPPGRYTLRTWAEKLPATARVVRIEAGRILDVVLPLVPASPAD
jgi:hypothetical protein